MTRRVAACLALQALALGPLLLALPGVSLNDDWTQLFAFNAFLRDQLLQGELPVRADWLGGGFPIAGHPEYAVLAPHTLLVLVAGPVAGIKLWHTLAAMLGTFGMYRFARDTLALEELPATYAAATMATLGWTAAITASGNVPQVTNLWWPLLFWLVADGRWTRVAWAAVAVAVSLLDGHLNVIASLLVLGVAALAAGLRVFGRAVAAGALGALLAGYKLVPTLALLQLEDRAVESIEASRAGVADFLDVAGLVDGFPLGPLPWLLAGAGVIWGAVSSPHRRALVATVCVAAALWLGLGTPLFAHLPVLRSLDAPAKYFVAFGGFAVVALAASVVGRLPAWAGRAALGLTVLPLLFGSWSTLHGAVPAARDSMTHTAGLAEPVLTDAFERPWRGPAERKPDLYVLYRSGFHVVEWEDNFRLPTAITAAWRVDTQGILHPLPWTGPANARDAQVSALQLTPNRVSALVTATGPTELVVNTNGGSNWRCAPEHRPDAALLTVPVPAGTTDVECEARSPPLLVGAGVTGIGLALVLALVAGSRRQLKPA